MLLPRRLSGPAAAATILTSVLSLSLAPFAQAATACNGSPDLCSRSYSKVTFVGSHNAPFVGALLVHNQFVSVTDQLDMGVRYLQAQSHEKDGGIEMCHTDCLLLDAGSLEKYLDSVTEWVEKDGNEEEVITLLITNGDGVDVKEFDEVFEKTGLGKHVFTPDTGEDGGLLGMDEWPSLGELVDAGTRVVVFMDYHSDTSSVPYILDQFAYYFEGPFDTTDPDFGQCSMDRPSSDEDPEGLMYLVNHYLDVEIAADIFVPNQILIPLTNSLDSIMQQADLCEDTWHRMPNVLLLDWINIGDATSAQEVLNGL
ncbi:hypothetical protein MKZ38_003828 [Zalerion maritima]|uniref:PLC-like phosphodiesterase n=1 Tax=Zalerion maritima TaxID=339359 RepID=A0AAD5RNB7_9PEZI|nr:hypothetical protein MKZ38_003828 [Zalerion maritima]